MTTLWEACRHTRQVGGMATGNIVLVRGDRRCRAGGMMGRDHADDPIRELERQLATEDPALASALSDVRKPHRLVQKRRLQTVAWVAVILLAVPSTVFAGIGVAFFCGVFGGVL